MSRSSFEAEDADEANVVRRLSSLVLSVGLVAACIGDAAIALQLTVLNSGRVRSSAGAVLSAGPARRAMVRRVAAEITRRAPAASVLSPKQLDQVASAAVRDPRFVAAFGDALVAVHKHTFNGARDPVVLTPEPVTAAVRDAMAASAPELGPALPPSSELTVDIDASSVPDLEAVGRGINAATGVGLAFLLNVVGTSQHWGNGQLGIGPLAIYTFSRSGASFAVQTGLGVLVVAVAVGLLNGLGAQWLSRTAQP